MADSNYINFVRPLLAKSAFKLYDFPDFASCITAAAASQFDHKFDLT